jgi:hypothetical protein
MTVIAAILESETNEDQVVSRLDQLDIEGLDWRVYRPEEDTERIMPAVRMNEGGTTGAAGQGVGFPLRMDVREDLALEGMGVPQEEADFYSVSHARGATVIVVETPSDYASDVRLALQEAGATRLSAE